MSNYREGLYDLLVTQRLREFLNRESRVESLVDKLEEADTPEYLARHLAAQIRRVLHALPADERQQRQIELANQLLAIAGEHIKDLDGDSVVLPGEILRAIYRGPAPPEPPTTPLAAHNLITNAQGESRLGFELEREMATADRVLMLVSFIQWRGWQRMKEAFHQLPGRGVPVRVLTTTYIGATQFRAIDALARLPNVELKVSLDGSRRRLHAKAWLFERVNGFSSVYVGSANLSEPALEDGTEWTVKISEVESPHIVERFRGAFETLWCDEEFLRFDPHDQQICSRVKEALHRAAPGASIDGPPTVFFDLRPHEYQQATLDRLEAERLDRGYFRNLVVAPTGTGKTLVAAFDYARQPYTGKRPRLLFLAHREELLRQGRDRFRHVLRDESFGELMLGGEDPSSYDHLFATVQSFRSRSLLESQGTDYWDYAVLDEAHHVPAESYRDLIHALRPRLLLGLTATPERMDGESILPWFDNRIADEMRLWHAIERQYLVPFDYYGIHDGTDLSKLTWSRGSYVLSELEHQYLGNNRRARLVAKDFQEIHENWKQARALGFCVSISHASYMADYFQARGIPAMAVTSESRREDRVKAATMLRDRQVNVLFTVDLFNEGVDIPEIDCVLFLRPTESSTVFLQQLGRGLRRNTGKTACLVLDFIGNQRREFRFDQRFSSLFGGTRQQVAREIETGITRLPGNCYFRLDKESRKIILDNLRKQLSATRSRMVAELKLLASQFKRVPSLKEYLAETLYELADIYKPSIGGWSSLLEEASLLDGSLSDAARMTAARFERLLHLDSPRRIRLYSRLADQQDSTGLPELDRRAVEMLTHRLLPQEARQPGSSWNAGIEQICAEPAACHEFQALCTVLLDRIDLHTDEDALLPDCPLYLHRQYMREEVLVGLGLASQVGARHTQTGRVWIEELNTEVFFVTLDKSEKLFSPTTRYEDFAVSRTRFHWQSQSTTSEDSATGRRYIRQKENGAKFLLFVRPKPRTPFVFLGPLRYVSHSGSRPMSIYWDLEYPMPARFFEVCASLRAA